MDNLKRFIYVEYFNNFYSWLWSASDFLVDKFFGRFCKKLIKQNAWGAVLRRKGVVYPFFCWTLQEIMNGRYWVWWKQIVTSVKSWQSVPISQIRAPPKLCKICRWVILILCSRSWQQLIHVRYICQILAVHSAITNQVCLPHIDNIIICHMCS